MTLEPRPFWYLRHGETDWNARLLSQGRTDVPLNETGLAQARRAAAILRRHHHAYAPIARIVASPLIRARRTAEIVAAALAAAGEPVPLACEEGLQEVCFGEQEGRPMGDWYDRWIAGEYTPAGAEPFAELRERAAAAVNRATAAEGVALIVGHGGLFRALRAEMGLPPNVRLRNAVPLWLVPGAPAWTLHDLSDLAQDD